MATPAQASKLNMFLSWLVVLTSALFFFYNFIQMNLFNSINSSLVKEFGFSAERLGYLYAFYSYGNVLFLFPAGMLLDRFSVRKILLVVFTISVIATYIFSNVSDFWIMNAARFAIGATGAFGFLSSIRLASRWFDPRHMALVIGMVVTMAVLGGIAAQAPLTWFTQELGWRPALQIVAILGLVLIAIQFIIVRDEPKGLEKIEVKEHVQLEKLGFWHSLGIAIVNKQNWLSGIYISLVNLPLFVFGGIWGVSYLTQVHNFDSSQATAVITMMFVGMMIGSPLSGWLSDRVKLRKLPMIIGAILSLSVMSAVVFAPTLSFAAEICLYLLLGLVISSQVIGYPVIAESNIHSITATATSLSSVLIMSGGMLVPFFGWLLDQSGGAQMINGVKIYSAADFLQANYMLLIGLLIALIASLLIKETYCKQLHKQQ